MRFFFFGTLMDRDVLDVVVERAPLVGGVGGPAVHARQPAWLDGYRRVTVQRETFPMVVAAPGQRMEGVVVEGLNATDIDRILFFESIEYAPSTIDVSLADGSPLSAQCFLTNEGIGHKGDVWEYERWLSDHKADCLRETRLWMALYGHVDCHEADSLWDAALAAGRPLEDMIAEVRAQSRDDRSRLAKSSA